MRTPLALGLGFAAGVGAMAMLWPAIQRALAASYDNPGTAGMYYGMSGYSPPPYFLPPEYLPNGPAPPRIRSHLRPGHYDPRPFFHG